MTNVKMLLIRTAFSFLVASIFTLAIYSFETGSETVC